MKSVAVKGIAANVRTRNFDSSVNDEFSTDR